MSAASAGAEPKHRPLVVATALLSWGVLTFGAVYPWGYGPLAAAIIAMAAWTWRPGAPRAAGWAALLVIAAIAIQLAPLGAPVLERLSPAATRLLATFDIGFANGIRQTHPLSIHPEATLLALGALAFAALWVPVCASILRRRGAVTRLARHLVVLGTAVAVIGLAQKATYNGKVLWFWTPEYHAWNSFGPFVNRNHFAGWMLLALPVAVGVLFAYARRSGPSRPGIRERILWLGSPAGTPVLLIAAGALAMACSLLWSMSRSGIAAGGVAMGIMAGAAIWRSPGSRHRWAVAASALTGIAAVVSWRGADTLFAWYGRTTTLEWRIQLWKDTWPAVQDFWLTGSGLNTYPTLLLAYPRADLRTLPRAAHNDYLQLALEGGVLVCVPVVILIAVLVREIVRGLAAPQDETTWWIRMGAVAGICGMAVQEISEFSLQVPGVALLFATCVALAIHPAPPSPRGVRGEASHSQAARGSLRGYHEDRR